jgi:hypothetical protein
LRAPEVNPNTKQNEMANFMFIPHNLFCFYKRDTENLFGLPHEQDDPKKEQPQEHQQYHSK